MLTTNSVVGIMLVLVADFNGTTKEREVLKMADLKLPTHVLDVLRDKSRSLQEELDQAIRQRIELDKRISEYETVINSIESLLGQPKTTEGESVNVPGLFEQSDSGDSGPNNIQSLSLGKASLEILKLHRRFMTAAEVLDGLKKAGRIMRSPNSRDMVSGALKKMPGFVDIRKDGGVNRYKAK